jgi:hypothetical protein
MPSFAWGTGKNREKTQFGMPVYGPSFEHVTTQIRSRGTEHLAETFGRITIVVVSGDGMLQNRF